MHGGAGVLAGRVEAGHHVVAAVLVRDDLPPPVGGDPSHVVVDGRDDRDRLPEVIDRPISDMDLCFGILTFGAQIRRTVVSFPI